MQVPPTHYAQSGDLKIAYQVVGDGPIDVVLVPAWVSNIEISWDVPPLARFFERVASFSRLILFDRRGSGMSDGQAGSATLEEQVDDVRAVVTAVGSEKPALMSQLEGAALSVLYAASHPDEVAALALLSPVTRNLRDDGEYSWAQSVEERNERVAAIIESWGVDSSLNPFTRDAGPPEPDGRPLFGTTEGGLAPQFARWQRLGMTPEGVRASLELNEGLDVRDVLPSVQCPTLVIRPEREQMIDSRHSQYVAKHIPDVRYVEVPGELPLWLSDGRDAADEIEHFLTGVRPQVESDRLLATVLFTDIVGSTERAAEMGDSHWRALLERHDALVRDEVRRHRGRFVKSLGDGSLAVFDGPSRAISSAISIRDNLRDLDLEIRAGLHTGECELLPDDDLGGLAVHIGARISSLAQSGEVLVSSTVRDLVVGSGRELVDRGEHDSRECPAPGGPSQSRVRRGL